MRYRSAFRRFVAIMSLPASAITLRSRASLALLALMMAIPFVQPVHLLPISSFHSEWLAAALGLAAAIFPFAVRVTGGTFPLPRITAIAGLLIAALAIQALAGRIVFPEVALLHSLYLLWAALLCTLGALLARDLGLPAMTRTLAWAVLLGGLCTALLVVTQSLHYPAPFWLVFPDDTPSANLGQRNHAANYLWLAVASAIHLRCRDAISPPMAVAALSVLVAASVLTGSRSPILYGVVLGALTICWQRQGGGRAASTALGLAVLAVGGQIIGSMLPGVPGSGLTGSRMAPTTVATDARWTLWNAAWNMFLDAPLLGNGVGNYHWRMFEITTEPSWSNPLAAEHAHNILMQWLADYGLPVTLIAVLLLLQWAWNAMRKPLDENRWWLLSLLAVIGVHSMLEYPLWYAYFLGGTAVLLGAASDDSRELAAPRSRLTVVVGTVLSATALLNLWTDYRRLEDMVYWTGGHDGVKSAAWKEATANLAAVANGSLLSPVANLGIALAMSPDRTRAPDQLLVCNRAMRYQPQPTVVAKCAILEEWLGNRQRAGDLLQRTALAFAPEQEETNRKVIRWREQSPAP